jgi:putative flavoprotein involved in K+ transport
VAGAERRSLVVVGAGPAGLAAAALSARQGHRPLVLERGDGPGWAWRQHHSWLVLHTTRRASALPLSPFGPGPRYPTRDEVVRYLEGYAERAALDLRPRCALRGLLPDAAGGWRLDTTGGEIVAERVVLATGAFARPRVPELAGAEGFDGPLCHSSGIRSCEHLSGRTVLVVGAGNTAWDLAGELLRVRARVLLAARGPIFAVPRDVAGASWRTLFRLTPELTTAAARRLGAAAARQSQRAAAAFWSSVSRRRFPWLAAAGLAPMQGGALIER